MSVHRVIPALTADGLRRWRVVLAGCLAAVALTSRELSSPLMAVVTLGALGFAAGFWPRLCLAAVVAAFGWFTLQMSEQRSVHDLSLPVVTLAGLLLVPWHTPRPEASRAYGFAVWWPSLTLGLAMASAAFTKLDRSGFAWFTSAAVRYHFVMDSQNAPTELGLRVAGSYPLAVALSTAAILAEATIIIAALTPNPRVRLFVFAEVVVLLLGFWLMQGVFWPLWWVCALAMLPWGGWVAVQPAATSLTRWQNVAVAALVLVQIPVTLLGIEREPYVSNFPMYSSTYADTAEFDDETRARFTRIVDAGAATAWALGLPQDARSTLVRAAEGTRYSQDGRDLLCARVQDDVPAEIELTIARRAFDWDNGRFTPERRLTFPPLALCKVCLTCSSQ